MEEVRHKTAKAWVEAIDKSHELEPGDDARRRCLGFFDHTDEKHHILSITLAKATGKALGDQRELLKTPEGRAKLIEGRA